MSDELCGITIYGDAFTRDDILKMFNIDFGEVDPELNEHEFACMVHDAIDEVRSTLWREYIPQFECMYIGREYKQMNDEQTMGGFKDMVLDDMKKLIKEEYWDKIDCDHINIVYDSTCI